MEKKIKTLGIAAIGSAIIGSAIIWGAVIFGSSYALKGTECYDKIQMGLIFGFIAHLLFIWGPLAAIVSKMKKENDMNK